MALPQRAVEVTLVVTGVARAALRSSAERRVKRPEKVKARPPAKASARRMAVLAVAADERAWAAAQLGRPATQAAAAAWAARAILVVPEELAAAA